MTDNRTVESQPLGNGTSAPDFFDPIQLTRRLIGFDTVNPPGNEAEIIAYITGLLVPLGFDCRTFSFQPGRPSLVAVLRGRGAKAPLCFAGHVDTVPLGNRRWSRDPFAGEIIDGRLYGRGSSDMKSGIAAFLGAAARFSTVAERPADLVLVIAAGEETGCEGSYHLAANTDSLPEVGALVVAEPTGNLPKVGHRGALWLEAETVGVAAHGSMPERGDNAIYKAAKAIGALQDFGFNTAPHDLLGSPSLSVGTVDGGAAVNIVPDQSTFTIDIRTVPGQENGAVMAALGQYLGEDVDIRSFVSTDSVFTDPADPWIQTVFAIAERYLGERPEIGTAPFFTDGSALKPVMGEPPTVILGPGETHMAHQTDEYCEVAKLVAAVDLYADLIEQWNEL